MPAADPGPAPSATSRRHPRSKTSPAPREAFTEITWRHGTRTGPGNPQAQMRSQFAAVRVRPVNRNVPRNPDGSLPELWLIAEWPADAAEPTDYWLSTLPEDTPLPDLVRLARIRWRIEHDYRELKQGLGLAYFEGRTFASWPHHVTLVTAAHLFVTTRRLTADPKAHGAARASTRRCDTSRSPTSRSSDTAPPARPAPDQPNQVLLGLCGHCPMRRN